MTQIPSGYQAHPALSRQLYLHNITRVKTL